MKYVFEKGRYPNLTSQEVKEFDTNTEAIEYAKSIGAEYVWDAPDDRNPTEVYQNRELAQLPLTRHQIISMLAYIWLGIGGVGVIFSAIFHSAERSPEGALSELLFWMWMLGSGFGLILGIGITIKGIRLLRKRG